jgi:hypothetical protein
MESPQVPQQPMEAVPAVVPQQVIGVPWEYQPPWDPVEQKRRDRARLIAWIKRNGKRLGALCSLSLFVYLAVAVAIFLLMGPEIMRGLYSSHDYLFIITPAIVPIFEIDGAALVGFFIIIALAVTISYIYIFGRSALPTLREMVEGKPGRHSNMLMIGGLFFASYLITVVSYFLVELGGATPNVPDFGSEPIWSQMYSSASATVWEELVSRVLLIGVPLFWIDLLARRKPLLPTRKYFLGGMGRFGYVEVALILFSAAMFGMGHVWYWDVWKVIPTVIGGLCFGYLYVKIGLHASIIFHVCFNFLAFPTMFAPLGLTLMIDLMVMFVWMPIGAMFIVYYVLRAIKFLRGARKNVVVGKLPAD